MWSWVLLSVGAVLTVYGAFVLILLVAGRRTDARAVARFVPDCVILFRRLLGDHRVSGWRKALLAGLVLYLASPIDLVPDFIPVAGQLDDAILVALTLRVVLRAGGPALIREHWPGPDPSLRAILRLTYGYQ
jgi:uncharacterized membrane protein YkvA (DUF1232 family)